MKPRLPGRTLGTHGQPCRTRVFDANVCAPMTSPTIRIRLAHQPPLYFVAAVVLASLLPLLFQFVPEASSAVALQRLPKLVASTVAFERIELPSFAVIDEQESTEQESMEQESVEDEDVMILEAETEPERKAKVVARPIAPERRLASATPRPSLEQRGKAACAARNKTAARDAFRSLPVGDDRRRTIRRACRDAGILIL